VQDRGERGPDARGAGAPAAGLPLPARQGRPEEFAMPVQQIVESPVPNGR